MGSIRALFGVDTEPHSYGGYLLLHFHALSPFSCDSAVVMSYYLKLASKDTYWMQREQEIRGRFI